MLHVGLTGNIASGKTAVAALLSQRGAAVLDADTFARAAVAPGTAGLRRVLDRFGPSVRAADGSLDRTALRRIVFADAAARRDLEAIIHPEVARLRAEGVDRAARQGVTVVVSDVPLLFEAGLEDQFDAIVLVDAPADVRLARLTDARGIDRAEARAMMAAQGDPAAKRVRADYVVDNAGTREDLERAVEQLWRELLARSASPSASP